MRLLGKLFIEIRWGAWLSLFLLISLLSFFSKVQAQKEKFLFGEKQKIHLLAVDITPNDSYMASQVTKSALKTLYQTGRYHILVGDQLDYKKIVIGIETLKIWAKKYKDHYQIMMTLREQQKGKILKRLRATQVNTQRFLPKVEEMLGKLFIPEEFQNGKTIIIDKRNKKKRSKVTQGGLKIRQNSPGPGEINSNVVVLTPQEIEEKRENPEKYYKARAKRYKNKTWGKQRQAEKDKIVVLRDPPETPYEPEPVYEEVKETPRVQITAKKPGPKPEPKPIVKPKKKPRKPILMRAGLYFDYENLTTDHLLRDVKTNILRYGAWLEPRLWTFFSGSSYLYAGGGLTAYSKRVIYRELQQKLREEYKLYLGYRHLFFNKHLEFYGQLSYGNRWWANLAEAFKGIQPGELRTTQIDLGASFNFSLFGMTHGLGAEYGFSLAQTVKYGSNSQQYSDTSAGNWHIFYDYHLGESSRIRLGYSDRSLDIGDIQGFSYSSSLITAQFILEFGI